MKKQVMGMLLAMLMVVLTLTFPASAYVAYESAYAFGDVNGDDNISSGDALLALQCSVKKVTLNYDEQYSADVDENWEITAADALLILQASVKKIVLTQKEDVYEQYQYIYVEPTGLTENTIYSINSGSALMLGTRNYDMVRLATAVQGLINRNNDKHKVAVNIKMDSTDTSWLGYIMGEGKTYNGMNIVNISTVDDFLQTFKDFMTECGIIAWDANVPATANVAATICGLENCLPVVYDTTEGSLYKILTEQYNIPVKMSLVGMFEEAQLGKKIADTELESTGSAKCDAYVWAMDKYLDRCNPEYLAYTLDGASSIDSNPVKSGNPDNTSNAQLTGIPNQDYTILKQCFFFDLTSYSLECPNDDLTQPLGTDAATFKLLLKKRYDLAGGKYGVILGFVPWHVKYTNFVGPYDLDPPRLEWQLVETITAFNCALEPDAPHPYWMSNGSLYTKYVRTAEPNGNAKPDEDVVYDPNTRYYAVVYTGDFDCSPWLKNRAWSVWNDPKRGSIDMTYSYNVNLVDRVPMIFDYVYEKQTTHDYFTAGEGLGYITPVTLFKGNSGKEADAVTRTLPDGARAYIQYAKPYYDLLKVDITSQLINGFSVMSAQEFSVYNVISPRGTFLQNGAAGPNHIVKYNGVPYSRIRGVDVSDLEKATMLMRQQFIGIGNSNFVPIYFLNSGTNYGTPSGVSEFVNAFSDYVAWKDPGVQYKYVSITTFIKLLNESDVGLTVN